MRSLRIGDAPDVVFLFDGPHQICESRYRVAMLCIAMMIGDELLLGQRRVFLDFAIEAAAGHGLRLSVLGAGREDRYIRPIRRRK